MKINKDTWYIIRSDRAGVFFGRIKELDEAKAIVTMTDCRRLWYWDGACSISELAVNGTAAPSRCKFTVTVPEMTIFTVIEVILCSDKAVASIQGVKEWKRS